MDSTHHDSKDWHISQASLQNSCLAESPSQPPQMQPYPPMPSMEHQYTHPYQAVMHPPVHHPLPSNSYLPPGKNDSDPRLPGMMAISQPGTPRPTHSPSHHATTSPIIKKDPTKYTAATPSPSSFHSAAVSPYAHPALARKRGGRNELFSSELGPFFSSTKPFDNLYALDRSTLLTTRIQAKMDRGFFLADNDWTCYRRNYFQVSGAFSIHGLTHHPNPYYADHHQHPQCLVQVDGQFHAVHHFYMSISARVSNSDKKIELVQHTPKRDKGPQTTPAPKVIVPGGNLNMSSVGANQSIVTFERIQFKTATANNGKRRAAQQYYVCLVDLYAEIEDTKQQVKVASCQSAPLVVRGRSPGHYSDNTNGEHHRYETGSHDDGNRFSAPPPPPFSNRAPPPHLASPGVMGPEYGSPYYQPYSNYSHFGSMQPPPPPQQQQQQHPQMPHGMMMGSAPSTPTHVPPSHSLPPPPNTNGGPYMVPSMTTSDPSSSETSSPDLYNNTNDDTKLNQNGMNIHMHHVDNSSNDWSHRSRMNSVGSSHAQSPATPYENQHQHSYFNNSNNNNNNTYTVSSYDHRKYSNSGASLQQQTS